jgi:hypothetical protein
MTKECQLDTDTSYAIRIKNGHSPSGYAYLQELIFEGERISACYVNDPAKAMRFPTGNSAREFVRRDDAPPALGRVVKVPGNWK